MTISSEDTQPVRLGRLAILDVARGLAVVAMAIYHFSWDLSWFAFVDWPVAQGDGWRVFAACIAGSFLFLAGVSLDLAHHNAVRWRSFWKREAIIVAAAAAVSLATYFTFGDTFVRFGILHSIAAASLIALPFVRLPLGASLVASAVFLTMPLWLSSPLFDGALWSWTGLGNSGFASVDYVPVAPWAGVTLAGVALSKVARRSGLQHQLAAATFEGRMGLAMRWLGTHSLPIYLLHQPLLYGLVWLAATFGPGLDPTERSFVQSCTQSCQSTWTEPETCKSACACTLKQLKLVEIWEKLTKEPGNQSLRAEMNSHHALCLADPDR